MKIHKKLLEKVYLLFTVFFNLYLFLITYIQYSSHRGTDFDIYGNYLNYFIYGIKQTLQEQTVGYFFLVSEISKFNINAMKISIDYRDLIYNHGIQITNYILFLIGLVGIYKLLISLEISKFYALTAINLISIFPPLVGLRMILKPEIMAFAFVPWLIFIILTYKQTNQKKYLMMALPLMAILLSLKSSITLMIGFTVLIFFGKEALKKDIILLGTGSVVLMSLLIFESFQFTNILIWDHKTPLAYDFKAPLSFLYSFNSDLWSNPYRDSQATSMWGILLLDTFNDYWERYWFHIDGYVTKNQFTNKFLIHIGSVISFIFYFLSIIYLSREKNTLLKKIGILGYIGLFVMIINSHNLIPFLTKNFNPGKGDPMKTHYFSFLLAFTFIYLYLKIFEGRKKVYSLIFLILMSSYSLQLLSPITPKEISSNQTLINKIHLLSPCSIGDPVRNIINYSHSWCGNENIVKAICDGEYNQELLPIDEGGYYVYPPDEKYKKINLIKDNNVVTVNNYFECLNYADGDYMLLSSQEYFSNDNIEKPKTFILLFLLSCLSIILFAISLRKDEKTHY